MSDLTMPSRRKFFGLMAAPAIIGISGRMSLWVPTTPLILPERQFEADFSTDNMRYKATERYITNKMDWRAVYGTTPEPKVEFETKRVYMRYNDLVEAKIR